MNLWTIPLSDFNDSIDRAKRQGQRLWAAQALTRFAFSDSEAIPLKEINNPAKNDLTFLVRERNINA